jgi:hypothetical protein
MLLQTSVPKWCNYAQEVLIKFAIITDGSSKIKDISTDIL